MSTCLKRISIFLMLAVALPVTAEDITPLVNSARSFHLTPEEKALFVEASDRFKKYEIPKSIVSNGVFWLDNDHLVMSSRKYPGWEAKPEEMSRVISYNVTNGKIIDSGYRGIVECLNHQGDMLLAQSDKEAGRAVAPNNYTWLAGRWGADLRQIDFQPNSFVPSYLCRFAPFGDAIYKLPPEDQPAGAAMITPLLPRHGVIENTVVRENGEVRDRVHLIKSDGQRVRIASSRLSRYYFVYQPWDEKYFELNTAPTESRVFTPSGEVHSYRIPTLFLVWAMTLRASVAPFPSKPGVLWDLQQGTGYWRKQGIYLQSTTELLRIDQGYPVSNIKISPDGCKLHARVMRGEPFRTLPINSLRLVIDLCRENI
jgi:hypothetical protein